MELNLNHALDGEIEKTFEKPDWAAPAPSFCCFYSRFLSIDRQETIQPDSRNRAGPDFDFCGTRLRRFSDLYDCRPQNYVLQCSGKARGPYRNGQRCGPSGRRYPPRGIRRRDGDIPGQVGRDPHWTRRNRYEFDSGRRGGSQLQAARRHGARRLYHRSFLQRWRWDLPKQHGDQHPDGYRSDCDTDEHGDLDAYELAYCDSDPHFDGDLDPDQHSYFDADRDRHTDQYSDGFTDRYGYGDRYGHADQYSDGFTDRYRYIHGDSHQHADQYRNAHRHSDNDKYEYGDADRD